MQRPQGRPIKHVGIGQPRLRGKEKVQGQQLRVQEAGFDVLMTVRQGDHQLINIQPKPWMPPQNLDQRRLVPREKAVLECLFQSRGADLHSGSARLDSDYGEARRCILHARAASFRLDAAGLGHIDPADSRSAIEAIHWKLRKLCRWGTPLRFSGPAGSPLDQACAQEMQIRRLKGEHKLVISLGETAVAMGLEYPRIRNNLTRSRNC